MPSPAQLLARLDALALSLRADPEAVALLALGSVGLETARLDAHSDLDFFVVVDRSAKTRYLAGTEWLERVHPVVFSFANTHDGRKVLFEDGIFAEYAVFGPGELQGVPFTPGRLVWKREDVPDELFVPAVQAAPKASALDWLVGEALTNIFVGLHREARGEVLVAARFIQSYAVDRVLDIAALQFGPGTGPGDAFSPERRFEQRFPSVAVALPSMMQGYEGNGASARCILEWLEDHVQVHPRLAYEIRSLCAELIRHEQSSTQAALSVTKAQGGLGG